MKTLLKIALFIALVALIASCQSGTDVKKVLSNQETKTAIMETIAADSNLSKEMMEAMMKSENSKMTMMEFHGSMMKMMKEDPAMMQSMMTSMMETCKNDTTMMSTMCKNIMKNPEMMEMRHKMGMKNME
jgi:hypothetical protein